MIGDAYLNLMDRANEKWARLVSAAPELRSAPTWDLLTHLWRAGEPVQKTDAIKAMISIRSPNTAAKYIEIAIESGIVEETDNPDDKRSKKLMLSDTGRARMDQFLDACVGDLLAASEECRRQ